ncbi:MAG: GNAT family N-acetyltransferase [Hyphomonadaceae bacterium]
MNDLAAPTLITDRLRLRAYRLSDFRGFADFYTSPRSQYADGPVDGDVAWAWFAAGTGRWALTGYGAWTIEKRDDNQAIGIVSLNHPVKTDAERELGWLLWEGHEGSGYATEAAVSARQFAFEQLGWETMVSYIARENAASIRLAERIGAHLDEAATQMADADTLVYRHNR